MMKEKSNRGDDKESGQSPRLTPPSRRLTPHSSFMERTGSGLLGSSMGRNSSFLGPGSGRNSLNGSVGRNSSSFLGNVGGSFKAGAKEEDWFDSLLTPTNSVFFGGWPSKHRLQTAERLDFTTLDDWSSFTSSRADFDDFENVEEEVSATDLQKVWIADPEKIWIQGYFCGSGKFVSSSGEFIEGLTPDSVHVCMDDDTNDHNDAVELQNLHEAPVLDLVRRRFQRDDIYTAVGGDLLLISVNPCRPIPSLFGGESLKDASAAGRDLKKYKPHIYATADAAYRGLMHEKRPQSILLSGESGAGKTEACKFVLRFLAYENGRNRRVVESGTHDISHDIEERLIQTNPVLEAFGNAKTHLNLNSSRFGKLVQIVYDEAGIIRGARVRTYLLEKSRVVGAASGERSFHVLYQLSKGASAEERAEYRVLLPHEYSYLTASDCVDVAGIDDAKDFQRTKRSLARVGFSEDEVRGIFRLLSGAMRCGNIAFVHDPSGDDIQIVGEDHLETVAHLFEVDREELRFSLTKRNITVGSDNIVSSYTIKEATSMRDGLAKAVYSELFEYIRRRLNEMLMKNDLEESEQFASLQRDELSIYLLDMAGFEVLPRNSLEQLFINYSNESLQGQFHKRIATVEKRAYAEEGIDWKDSPYDPKENLLRVEALQGSDGVITMLDEEGRTPGCSDQRFRQKIMDSKYGKPLDGVRTLDTIRCKANEFRFHHFAGEVEYDVDGMLTKNKDFLHVHVEDLVASSISPVLSHLFAEASKQRKNRKELFTKRTIWMDFKAQVEDLNAVLQKTTPRYVRCLKPNDLLQPGDMNSKKILYQLKCSGVLEYISVRRSGLPVRMHYFDFAQRFRILAPPENFLDDDHMSVSYDIMSTMEEVVPIDFDTHRTMWAFGRTKVFLADEIHKLMERERLDRIHAGLIYVQSKWRMKSIREQSLRDLQHVRNLESQMKGLVHSTVWIRQRVESCLLQAAIRRSVEVTRIHRVRSAQEMLARAWRTKYYRQGHLTLKKFTAQVTPVSRRCNFRKKFVHITTENQRREEASCKVVRAMRRAMSRMRTAESRSTVEKLGRAVRRRQACANRRFFHAISLRLQAQWRRYAMLCHARELRGSSVKIACGFRSIGFRKRHMMDKGAVGTLNLAYREHRRKKQAALGLNLAFRVYQRKDRAAVLLAVVHRAHQRKKRAALLINMVYRVYQRKKNAAVTLTLAYRAYQRKKHAAIFIGRAYQFYHRKRSDRRKRRLLATLGVISVASVSAVAGVLLNLARPAICVGDGHPMNSSRDHDDD